MWTLLTFLFGVATGVAVVVAAVWYILSFFFLDPEKKETQSITKPKEPTSATFQLPPILLTKISDESCKSKESCWALNFVLYFLFRELRNSEGIRRWILRKLSMEFDELLSSSVLGKFFSSISIQNVDLGHNFPIFNWLKTTKVEMHPVFKNISTLDILVDLDYAGGFQFAIQAETHLKHSAFLAVQFNGVKGQARLQFTTEPYAHWSFSFAENPDIDISVVSQLYGKSFSHITSIIASQLKRSVRKKHTLPMYKIRYKPFFARVEPIIAALVPNSSPRAEVKGDLTMTVIECRGLIPSLLHGNVYSTIALGDYDWVAAYVDNTSTISIVRDLVYVKTARRETNLDFTIGLLNDIPIIESFTSKGESSHRLHLEFEVGDEILTVDGKKVSSIKQCVRNFKNSSSMKVIWRIRRKCYFTALPKLGETISTDGLIVEESTTGVQPNGMTAVKGDIKMTIPSDTKDDEDKMRMELMTSASTSGTTASKTATPLVSRRNSFTKETPSASDTLLISQDQADASVPETQEQTGNYGFRNSLHDTRQCRVDRTKDIPYSRDPIFTETFSLKVDESHRFLNLAVWSVKSSTGQETTSSPSPTSSPSKRSKTSAANLETITFGEDRLIGTLSIPIADVIAECSTTGMGYFVKDYYLGSPEGNAAEAKDNPLTAYSGFEPHMCYGKISLSFLFKSEEDASKHRDSAEVQTPSILGSTIEIATDALSVSPIEEFQTHQFVRTHFRSATVCDYCNKKIWLKEAFACRICHMRCHKKCNDRCIANTICKGEGFYPTIPDLRNSTQSITPEIITTGEIDELPEELNSEVNILLSSSSRSLQPGQTNGSVRRRTLGGLIVSAVQNRSAQLHLRRAGSASNLLSPNQNPNTTSKSLPPSPKASPTTSRKTSVLPTASSSTGDMQDINPFEVLSAGGFGSSEEDIHAAVEHLIQNPNDDLIALAKETGRDVYSDLSLTERKQKLNHVLNRLQEEIDVMSTKRMELSRGEMAAAPAARSAISKQIEKYEERVQALALLMLYYCSGLQRVQELQDLEELEKDEQIVIHVTEINPLPSQAQPTIQTQKEIKNDQPTQNDPTKSTDSKPQSLKLDAKSNFPEHG